MVSKFHSKNPLTLDERNQIEIGIKKDLSYSEIAFLINRYKSVIQREVKRFDDPQAYNAEKAQKNFESKQRLSGIKRGSKRYLEIKKEENL